MMLETRKSTRILLPLLTMAHVSSAASFDFVIIGGGTSGLVLANRLTEIPSITVAVIEAGGEVNTNPNVTDGE